MSITVLSVSNDELVFDIVGVDLAIVNALRRILLAEVCKIILNIIYNVI